MNLIVLKNFDVARQHLEKARDLNLNGMTLSACGALYGRSGEEAKARRILDQMLALDQSQPVARYDLGIVHACLGDLDTAYTYFEAAIEKHEPPMLFFKSIVRDWLSGFEQDARYELLLGKIFG